MAARMFSGLAPSATMAATVSRDDAAGGALPAGMGGADDAGLGVGEQHRRAVGGEDAEQQVRAVGDHRVGFDRDARRRALGER